MPRISGSDGARRPPMQCAGCEPGHIDLSPNLFQNFGTLGEGTVYGSWSFGGSAEPAKKPSPSPSTYPSSTPSPTPTPKPKPSSSSSSTAEKPTSSGPPSSIHSSATSTASATATASSSAVPTSSAVFDPSIATQGGEVDGADTGALYGLNLAIVQIGAMLDSAHGA
ncbi:hypothetical protein FA95DRAFT_1566816 [Auriscalpium vulgare]|uniref:Uncharacterized protein n=1 Tax=Auriscalpium vulgare TaxID=40419 RepID=A0ACB8R7U9_9AGAM|nr:hypothetical protein FA95DRAFT_1566816 [Auriscalpium vulgare]